MGVKLRDVPLGSSHPSCELILFNQALREAIDQALKCVLLFETPGFESLGVLQGSHSRAVLLKLPLQLLGILKEIADLTPYRRFQKLSLDLPIAADALAPKAVAVRPSASIIQIILRTMAGPALASGLAIIGIPTGCTAGKSLQ